jgi:hypothetical protein
MRETVLCGGPHDGQRVKGVGGPLPPSIFVNPKSLDDGYAAWSRTRSERFPHEYAHRNGKAGYIYVAPTTGSQ